MENTTAPQFALHAQSITNNPLKIDLYYYSTSKPLPYTRHNAKPCTYTRNEAHLWQYHVGSTYSNYSIGDLAEDNGFTPQIVGEQIILKKGKKKMVFDLVEKPNDGSTVFYFKLVKKAV